MVRRSKTLRRYSALDLARLFPRIVKDAHIHEGRDSKLLKEFQALRGYDAIDVIYCMIEYKGISPYDVRSFIRWCIREDPVKDCSYEYREYIVAEWYGQTIAPISVLVLFDLQGEASSYWEQKSLEKAQDKHREFVNGILGERE